MSNRSFLAFKSIYGSLLLTNITLSYFVFFSPRTDALPPNNVAVRVLNEARYFGLSELEERMSVIPSVSSVLVKENHRLQFPDYMEVPNLVTDFFAQHNMSWLEVNL